MSGPRVALVTGAAGGIGRATVDALVRRGDRVLATDLSLEPLEARAAAGGWRPPQVELLGLDVRDATSWSAAVGLTLERWGRLDVLFNVAGYLRPGYLHETPLDEIGRHLDVNARGVMLGTRAAAEVMVRQRAGHIVNVASMASLAPVPGIGLYTASKYAVRAFSLVAAQELRAHGVDVTVVCPDLVATPMLEAQVAHEEAALSFSGAKRPLDADDVAAALTGRVLERRPLELWLPSSRGWLARAADLFPRLGFRIGGMLRRKGLARQRAWRAKTSG